MSTYYERHYRIPADAEEILTAELWACGAVGFQSLAPDAAGDVDLTAFFENADDPQLDPEREAELGATRLGDFALPGQDWLAAYRARARPFAVGERFVVDPRDADDSETREQLPDSGGRILLRIPAQTAFGTGSHESTRLAIAMLERLAAEGKLQGKRVLDVGTGSGILCFVAEKLGARAAGYDIDAAAVCIARLNAELNGCRTLLFAADASALAPTPHFDLLVINELPERILQEYPPLLHTLKERGLVISSGNLAAKKDELLADFARLGLVHRAEIRDGEWIAFLLELEIDRFGPARMGSDHE